ncbi:MAG TPA: beta-N-acetylhexosaminidase [Myxococcota bacterium]|nr:beta-N-acetylhexosaminidase [Myxococcota bacterium]
MTLLLLLACTKAPTPKDSDLVDSGEGADSLPDAAAPSLIPRPTRMEAKDGTFLLTATTGIIASGDAIATAELLAEGLRLSTGYPLPVTPGSDAGGNIVLDFDSSLPPEGYTLTVTSDGVHLSGADADGLFWATQSLRQLLPPENFQETAVAGVGWVLPAVEVEDAPRFAWRGGMIDVARHFFTVAEVKRQIDLFALHKLNRLHLHLTDDQGWRIEIKSWPDLTRIGGSTEVGGGEGGFYTQADYQELVAYAEARHILLIPELDFPGHAHAARASYGALNPDGQPLDLYTGEGVISTGLWLDGPSTRDFVEDVWTEIATITPGPYLHVGGDEAIDSDPEDYAAFLQWLSGVVQAQDKTLIGWDEVGTAGLEGPFIAQYWWSAENARAAVANGAQMIASPAAHCYLDMKYDRTNSFGQVWAGYVNVEESYAWNPILSGLDEADVMGVEAPMWTEFIDDEAKMDFMLWPRLAAQAEVGWTAESDRNWEDFRTRLATHGARLDNLNVGYYASPEVDW